MNQIKMALNKGRSAFIILKGSKKRDSLVREGRGKCLRTEKAWNELIEIEVK